MISEIHLKNFRLFDNLNLKTNNSLVIFSGANATGKTSVLEAIYLASTTRSHRTNDILTLIKNGSEFAMCEIDDLKKYKVIISSSGKTLFINGVEIKKTSEFIGNLNVVMFSPSDLSLINGAKGEKRRFLDLELSLLDKSYLSASTHYKRILKERNEALKSNNVDIKYLDILTSDLVKYTEIIYQKRVRFLSSLNEILSSICIDMDIEKIKLCYNKTYGDDISLSFKNKLASDLFNKTTNIGVHRDDFSIFINDCDSKEYASNGQARTIIIAIKLALKQYIYNTCGIEPVLLLDDVFAALDKKRIASITKYVNNSHQTFITTTSILEIPDELLKNALIIRL